MVCKNMGRCTVNYIKSYTKKKKKCSFKNIKIYSENVCTAIVTRSIDHTAQTYPLYLTYYDIIT